MSTDPRDVPAKEASTAEDTHLDSEPGGRPDSTRDSEESQRMAARALRRAQSSGPKKSATGSHGTSGGTSGGTSRHRSRRRGSSRDPQEVGDVLGDFLAEQGWESTSALAALTGTWSQIVGPEVAEHVQVESVTEGELRLLADSTAWATQMRLLSATVLAQVQQAVGSENVQSVSVRGPSAPSWKAGPRVVKGRGPRDTYG